MRSERLYCRAIAFDGLFEFISEKGGDPVRLAKDVGLDLTYQNNKLSFLNWNTMCDFLEHCADRLDAPSFGIEWAHTLNEDLRNSGPMLLAGWLSQNLRHGLNLAIKYQKIHTNGVTYSIDEDADKNVVRGYVDIHPFSHKSRQYSEHILALIAIYGPRNFPQVRFSEVNFQHDRPKDLSWHIRTFDMPINFNQNRNMMIANLDALDSKPTHLAKLLTPLLSTYLDRRERRVSSRSSVAMGVAELIPYVLGLRQSRITDVAKIMGVSDKKLQRLLRAENTSYSAILEDVRQRFATRLLTDSQISMTRIAKMLDYASIESFNAACNRWHGASPTQIRRIAIKKAAR